MLGIVSPSKKLTKDIKEEEIIPTSSPKQDNIYKTTTFYFMRFSKAVSDQLLAKIRDGEQMTTGEKLNLIIQLSIPSILAQVTAVMMFYIDASMVGSLGAGASASIGLVEPATWLFGSLVGAFTMGFSVQAAHFIGANDFAKARSVMRHGYIFGAFWSTLLAVIMALIAGSLPPMVGWRQGYSSRCVYLYFSFFVGNTCTHGRELVGCDVEIIGRYAPNKYHLCADVLL